jgi:hypothetical protein
VQLKYTKIILYIYRIAYVEFFLKKKQKQRSYKLKCPSIKENKKMT